jgi:hypothetical protein
MHTVISGDPGETRGEGGQLRHGTHLFLTEQSKQVVLVVFTHTCCTSILAETYFRGHLSGDIGLLRSAQSYCIIRPLDFG